MSANRQRWISIINDACAILVHNWATRGSLLTTVTPLVMARPYSSGKTVAYWATSLGCCGRRPNDSLTL
eukprot:10852545-Lingulodinium_polyedra.AAC.1